MTINNQHPCVLWTTYFSASCLWWPPLGGSSAGRCTEQWQLSLKICVLGMLTRNQESNAERTVGTPVVSSNFGKRCAQLPVSYKLLNPMAINNQHPCVLWTTYFSASYLWWPLGGSSAGRCTERWQLSLKI